MCIRDSSYRIVRGTSYPRLEEPEPQSQIKDSCAVPYRTAPCRTVSYRIVSYPLWRYRLPASKNPNHNSDPPRHFEARRLGAFARGGIMRIKKSKLDLVTSNFQSGPSGAIQKLKIRPRGLQNRVRGVESFRTVPARASGTAWGLVFSSFVFYRRLSYRTVPYRTVPYRIVSYRIAFKGYEPRADQQCGH